MRNVGIFILKGDDLHLETSIIIPDIESNESVPDLQFEKEKKNFDKNFL